LVLRGWWKESRVAVETPFEELCAELGVVGCPRWFLRERPGGRPWEAAWLNLKAGVQALFCTFALIGPGCGLASAARGLGWFDSFWRSRFFALRTGAGNLPGVLLLIVSLIYLPVAQIHQAVTGDVWAFFDFRFLRRLVHARPGGYVGLTAVVALGCLAV